MAEGRKYPSISAASVYCDVFSGLWVKAWATPVVQLPTSAAHPHTGGTGGGGRAELVLVMATCRAIVA